MATVPHDNEERLSRAAALIDPATPLFSAERGVESVVNNANVGYQYLRIKELQCLLLLRLILV